MKKKKHHDALEPQEIVDVNGSDEEATVEFIELNTEDTSEDTEEQPDEPVKVLTPEELVLEAHKLIVKELEAKLEDKERSYKHLHYEASKHENELKLFRDRLERDNERKLLKDRHSILSLFFEPLDNLERSVGITTEWEKMDERTASFVGGVKMVLKSLQAKLEGLGLERFESVGEAFDPNIHEAMGTQPVDDPEKNDTVLMTWEAGYKSGDHVIRAAKVIVGKLQS
jgi:molecular chaperone GrpE